jgi:hypothetical protein
MLDPTPTWTAVAFWAGLAAVICTWLVTAAARRKHALDTIRSAIERGQPLDAQTIELLLGKPSRAQERRDLRVQAYVWLALGAGFAVWALIGFDKVHMVILGLGAVIASVGVGLLVAARLGLRDDDGDDAAT